MIISEEEVCGAVELYMYNISYLHLNHNQKHFQCNQ